MKFSIHIILISFALLFSQGDAAAEPDDKVVSSDDIAEALEQPKTRGLTRGIRVHRKAKVDLNIPFELNSSNLARGAEQQLDQLSDALLRDSFESYRFEIAGHTDASGTADHNRQLSEQRAESVKQFLVDKGVSPNRLQSIGYGEDELLLTDDPRHPDNRRVEIRNLGAIAAE